MHYDDEARRFNFISGLACGVVLGSGLALIASPRNTRTAPGRLRKVVKRSSRRYAPEFDRLRNELEKVKTGAQRAAERVREDTGRTRKDADGRRRSRRRKVSVEA